MRNNRLAQLKAERADIEAYEANLNNIAHTQFGEMTPQQRMESAPPSFNPEIAEESTFQNWIDKKAFPQVKAAAKSSYDATVLGTSPKIGGALGVALRKLGTDSSAVEGMSDKQLYAFIRDKLSQERAKSQEEYPAASFVGAIASPIPKGLAGAKTFGGAAAKGAAYGGLYGLGSSNAGPVGELTPENIGEGIKHAAIGSLFGPLAHGVGLGIGKGIEHAQNIKFDSRNNLSYMPREKITPEQLQRIELAEKYGVQLTPGQITGNAKQLSKEAELASGAKGGEAAQILSGHHNAQTQNLNNVKVTAPDLLEPGSGLNKIGKHIQSEHTKSEENVSKLYKALEDKGAQYSAAPVRDFAKTISSKIEDQYSPDIAKNTFFELKKLNNKIIDKKGDKLKDFSPEVANQLRKKFPEEFGESGVDFKTLFNFDKELTNSIRNTTEKSDRNGLRTIQHEFRNMLDKLDSERESTLISGNPALLNLSKKAREAKALHHEKFDSRHKREYGQQYIEKLHGNKNSREDFSNGIHKEEFFGGSKFGFDEKTSSRAKALQKVLGGKDSQIYQETVVPETLNRVLEPLRSATEEVNLTTNTVEKFQRNLREHKQILKDILPDNEYRSIFKYGQELKKLMELKVAPKHIPSYKSASVPGMIFNGIKMIPGVGHTIRTAANIGSIAGSAASAKGAKDIVNPGLTKSLVGKINKGNAKIEVPTTGTVSILGDTDENTKYRDDKSARMARIEELKKERAAL